VCSTKLQEKKDAPSFLRPLNLRLTDRGRDKMCDCRKLRRAEQLRRGSTQRGELTWEGSHLGSPQTKTLLINEWGSKGRRPGASVPSVPSPFPRPSFGMNASIEKRVSLTLRKKKRGECESNLVRGRREMGNSPKVGEKRRGKFVRTATHVVVADASKGKGGLKRED